jgi:hypothetical protein
LSGDRSQRYGRENNGGQPTERELHRLVISVKRRKTRKNPIADFFKTAARRNICGNLADDAGRPSPSPSP